MCAKLARCCFFFFFFVFKLFSIDVLLLNGSVHKDIASWEGFNLLVLIMQLEWVGG